MRLEMRRNGGTAHPVGIWLAKARTQQGDSKREYVTLCLYYYFIKIRGELQIILHSRLIYAMGLAVGPDPTGGQVCPAGCFPNRWGEFQQVERPPSEAGVPSQPGKVVQILYNLT